MAESVLEPIFSGRTLNIRDLNEVIASLEKHHYSKISYHQLGLRLKLSHNTLEKIKKDHGEVDPCFTECLASWLRKADDVETPTIDTLIAAFRGIGENAVADGINEERQISARPFTPTSEISNRPILATPLTMQTSEEHSTQPIIVNPGVHDLELKVDQVSKLRDIANELQDKFDYLVLAVKKSLENNFIDIEDAKMLIHGCLKRKARVVSQLLPCINILKKVNNFKGFFEFLSEHDFIGFLNYKLLKKLSKLVDDDKLNERFAEYEKEYAKLLSAGSFKNLIPLFEKRSDLSPTAPLGLPYVSFCVEKPDSFTSAHDCLSTFDEFSWSQDMFLKQLQKKCIIITYAILPCVLDDVMRDLKDPVILKELKDNDITVIELPQEEEEDFEGKEEDPQIESTAKAEPRVGASSIVHTTSSEGNIHTTSTTTLTSEANIQQEVSLFEHRAEPTSIQKEFKSSNLNRELIKSIEFDTKPEVVAGLLEAGANPNYLYGGATALIIAIEKDYIDVVKLLLEKGADPNCCVKYYSGGPTALIKAIKNKNIGIVEVLLEKGADPNIGSDTYEGTPLHCAIETGNANIIKLLIIKGNADVNAMDKRKRTPLFEAVKSSSIETVDILLTNGARTDVVDEYGDTPLLLAVKRGTRSSTQIIKSLIIKGQADVTAACKKYHINPELSRSEIAELLITKIQLIGKPIESHTKPEEVIGLLEIETDPNITEYLFGGTALITAIENDNIDIVKLLLEKGANPNVTKDNETPLFVAVKSGNIEAVDILLTNGARTDVVSKYHGTPLHCASQTGNADIIKLLIIKGSADVNAVDKDNSTPLFIAVKSGSIEAVDILLTNGARTDVVSKYHGTPLHCASQTGNADIIKLLITKGSADVNAVDKDNSTPLFIAVKSGSIEAVDILLTNGARTDVVSKVSFSAGIIVSDQN
ncbi:PREDICTED: ankyrin repeat, PH and SEC7 domain containing protein secG-like [Amphimedon queenslandica]|uniref:Death domain-containing protein n=1 Tax=Amphimedon queenslandica TaxID=400682 RepID=A0AAN0JF18_AMPQE|nr:PREDICTED: ankyrin repeat, PH and SEC7 domain containing protein secG-like [Amphimedon queenslandica]|eukprot:XP_019855630.1 PREDICTED: ankyrin repeat, PH and SEC7 domain containing protein secG-like [Amphimedon queenslandica]